MKWRMMRATMEVALTLYHSKGTMDAGDPTQSNDPDMGELAERLWSVFALEEQRD